MRKLRILTALVTVSLVGGLAAATTPAANALTSHPSISAEAAIPAVPPGCTYKLFPAVTWIVNASNIHIRYSPAGRYHYSIARNARFVSDVLFNGIHVVCINRHPSGRVIYWIYGYDRSHPSHSGWIGCNYLDRNTQPCPVYLHNHL